MRKLLFILLLATGAITGYSQQTATSTISQKAIVSLGADLVPIASVDQIEVYVYFDDQLYKQHYVIERTTAWMALKPCWCVMKSKSALG